MSKMIVFFQLTLISFVGFGQQHPEQIDFVQNVSASKSSLDSIIGYSEGSKSKEHYIYNPDESLNSAIYFSYVNSLWQPLYKLVFAYSNKKVIEKEQLNWDKSSKTWINKSKTKILYTDANKVKLKIELNFNSSTSKWDTNTVEERTYSNNGIIEESTISNYNSTGHVKTLHYKRYRNKYGSIDSLFTYSYNGEDLILVNKQISKYDAEGYRLQTALMTRLPNGTFQTNYIEEVNYDKNHNPQIVYYVPNQYWLKNEYKYNLSGNYLNVIFPQVLDDGESKELFRNGIPANLKGYKKTSESGLWVFLNVEKQYYYSNGLITANKNRADQNHFAVYPNPSSEIINIKFADNTDDKKSKAYTLSNINGLIIRKDFLDAGQSIISLEDIQKGIYFLEISVSDKKYYKKIYKY